MEISVVIPTCNRPDRLLSLLENLNRSTHPLREVLVIDSSDERLGPEAFAGLDKLGVTYLSAARSVCVQRNAGIRLASAPWIFLCDDDMEIPPSRPPACRERAPTPRRTRGARRRGLPAG